MEYNSYNPCIYQVIVYPSLCVVILLTYKQANTFPCLYDSTQTSVPNFLKQRYTLQKGNQDYFLFPSLSNTRVFLSIHICVCHRAS